MELIFNKEEVEALLLEKAESIGIKANKVVLDVSYGYLRNAHVSFEEKKNGESTEPRTEFSVLANSEDATELL